MAAFDRKKKADQKFSDPFLNNPYVLDKRKGLQLLTGLIGERSAAGADKIDRLVDRLAAACGRMESVNLEDRLRRIRQLVALLKSHVRQRVLSESAIIGVGGQFSSGKSSLLNSLFQNDSGGRGLLPVSTSPSTSVPAYILAGKEEKITACMCSGREKSLDADQLWALSHAFVSAYKVNPAQFLDFIAIERRDFPLAGVALMDTPGFDKADAGKISKFSDRARTLQALSSVDHLIWLINSSSATALTTEDLTFLRNLSPAGKLTVIVTKAKGKAEIATAPEPDESRELRHIRSAFAEKNLPCERVFAYEAFDPDWNYGREKLFGIMRQVQNESGKKSRYECLSDILGELENSLRNEADSRHVNDMHEIEQIALKSCNPPELATLVGLRGMMGLERVNLHQDYASLRRHAGELKAWARESTELHG